MANEEPVGLYQPVLAAPTDLRGVRFWLQQELLKVAKAMVQGDLRLLDFLVDDNTGILTDWMHWAGYWAPGEYRLNDVVLDDQWTMVVTNPAGTTDRAAPQPVGDPEQAYPVDNFSTLTDPGWVTTGNRYTFTKDGWLTNLRGYIPNTDPDLTYYIGLMVNPGQPGQGIVVMYRVPASGVVLGWVNAPLDNILVLSGDVYEAFLITENLSGVVYDIDGTWQYAGSSQSGDPYFGGWNHNNQHTTLRIHEQRALGEGPEPNLANLDVGDTLTITAGAAEWIYVINAPATFASQVYTFSDVTRAQANGTIGSGENCNIKGGGTSAAPTDYAIESAYWAANPPSFATVQGFLDSTEGVGGPLDDNAYGADIEFQEGAASPDWEVVAYSGSLGGASGGGGIAAYGSIGFDGVVGSFTINNITSRKMDMDLQLAAAPVGITYDLANDGLRVTSGGTYQIDLRVEFTNGNPTPIGRTFRVGLYDETAGGYVGQVRQRGITPGNEITSVITVTWVEDLSAAVVGHLLSLRIGGDGTSGYSGCFQERASLSLTRIDTPT